MSITLDYNVYHRYTACLGYSKAINVCFVIYSIWFAAFPLAHAKASEINF